MEDFTGAKQCHAEWVIIGAETGNRKSKVIPRRDWIMPFVESCEHYGTPVFMKESLREIMGSDFADYNLVLALETGWPCEDRIILKQFDRLKKEAGLPDVVFHSLRHSSTTYNLKINHGNIKATQGDTGHAQSDMVTDLYAHILDEDRKLNAQRFEIAFYSNPNMQQVEAEVSKPSQEQSNTLDLQHLFSQLQQNPEVLGQLAALLKSV